MRCLRNTAVRRGLFRLSLLVAAYVTPAAALAADAGAAGPWSASVGVMHVDGDAVPAEIRGGNPDDVAVRPGDRSRFGLRLGAVRRWDPDWSFDLAWVDLGESNARLGGQGATADEILEAAENLQPQTAYGVSVGMLRHWDTGTPVRVSLGGGVWAWRSEWDVRVGGRSRDYHETGTDPYATLALEMPLRDGIGIRARWTRYGLEAGSAETLGVEVTLRFD
jgi:hypothetical protein